MIDTSKMTTPDSIDQRVQSFCRRLSCKTPIFMDVEPELWCRQSCCEMNVDKVIDEKGGTKVFGYKIWYIKRKYIEAERHAVWLNNGEFSDPTFNVDGESKVLFVEDDSSYKTFDDRPLKIRKGFTQRARQFAHITEQQDEFSSRMSEEESWRTMPSYQDWLNGVRKPNLMPYWKS